jgi:hypothetical protein
MTALAFLGRKTPAAVPWSDPRAVADSLAYCGRGPATAHVRVLEFTGRFGRSAEI